ncbi:hypothetical protein AWE51_18995 [Aquimarina aggregata]|uniref:SMP-30/Gluconolactonase/LRE-like region domain-containing protein n=1 Tax=Aquimarina aggregata TaxID=1642818 RepID=A0A162WJ42_9FLAO|nr:SMP-30/gluconolactonase/LRE family protein [Aquimarina aggregata]KZS38133.1 hypothetical protein AWE51_18995 [Aquimarina aggregata]
MTYNLTYKVVLFFLLTTTLTLTAQAPIKLSSDQFKFTEGPVWDGTNTIYFTDIPNSKVISYALNSGTFSEAFGNTNRGNGLMFSKDYDLLICEGAAGKINKRSVDGTILETLAATYQNKRFNNPNDLCVDKHGGIYFTDPTWGTQYQSSNNLYYRNKNGVITQLDSFGNDKPNGVIISPNGKYLYLNNSWSTTIYRYDINQETGALSNRIDFATIIDPDGLDITGADGMAVDTKGNLYVTAKFTVQVFDTNGKPSTTINFPEKTTNCTFGGKNKDILFVTAGKNLYKVEMPGVTGFQHPFDLLAMYTTVPPIGKVITFRKGGGDKKFITTQNSNNNQLVAETSTSNTRAERFLVEVHPKGGVALKSMLNNKYIRVFNKNTDIPIRAAATGKGGWTQFTWLSKGNGKVALKSVHANKWIQAIWTTDNAILFPKGERASDWETFSWEIVANVDPAPDTTDAPIGKTISLRKTNGDKKYVTAEQTANNKQLIARAIAVQGWEKFSIETHPDGGIALKALSNANYVQVQGINVNAAAAKKDKLTQFIWKNKGNGKVALKSVSANKWIQASWSSDNAVLFAKGIEDKGWETFDWKIENTQKTKAIGTTDQSLNAHPNPLTENTLNIDLPIKETTKLILYDTTGKVIFNEKVMGGTTIARNCDELGIKSSGLYTLKITSKSTTKTIKILR